MTKRFGFTLAEVLITLGIIGVVAAMTMPTLINQTNGAQYKAAYKKALSAISQGITLNVALDDKSFADATVASTTTPPDNSIAKFLQQRMNVVNIDDGSSYSPAFPTFTAKVCTDTVDDETVVVACATGTNPTEQTVKPDIFMYFNDSSTFGFFKSSTECKQSAPCYGAIDVNGIKGPNKVVEDGNKPTDIYPVVYYDQTILPASDAANAVLYGK